VPFSDTFLLDAFCQTPASRNYHFFDYNSSIENDVTKIYFEYGAAESGNHLIDIEVITSQNINIHIYIEEYLPLDTYYNHFTLEGINKSKMFRDINQYSLFKNDMEYIYPVKDDMEYKFNFFRVNPISVTDIVENAFENPKVIMRIILNETEYVIYRDISTLDYSLYGNVENDEFLDLDRNFINTTFTERFGAHCTENLSICITIEGTIPFDLNFAFLVWEVGEIGNGTDGIGENQNMTIPNPLNNNTDTELHNQTLTKTLDEWIARAGLFIQSNWWTIFLIMGTILVVSLVYGKYKYLFKEKIIKFKNMRHTDHSDGRKETEREGLL